MIKFFRDGFSSGIIKLKGAQLNGEARKKARMDFEKMREGSTGGSPLVFDDTQEYTPLEIDYDVLQLLHLITLRLRRSRKPCECQVIS